jgi:CRISPR/Cas system-associated protein Cas10 (large subunit of type III CRISPR-Cas system)
MSDTSFDDLLAKLPEALRERHTPGIKTKRCPVCKTEFKTKSSKRRFCKDVCRVTFHRVKKLVEKQERENGRS